MRIKIKKIQENKIKRMKAKLEKKNNMSQIRTG